MVRLEVPARVYVRAIHEMEARHRHMWAVMDIVPGKKWRVHNDPWERIEAIWKAEDTMKAIREALRAKRM